MPDIHFRFPIDASPQKVFDAVSTPEGLAIWWAKTAKGEPRPGQIFELDFGPEYQWEAIVTRCEPPAAFELQITKADSDWANAKVGFELTGDAATEVLFYHTGWPRQNRHFEISSFCWAMYLRLLKRYLERGETVAYEQRLDV